MIGKVRFWNSLKGYGFIRRRDGEQDVFVHYSAIRGNGFRSLSTDQEVGFTLEHGPRGPVAANVETVEELDS